MTDDSQKLADEQSVSPIEADPWFAEDEWESDEHRFLTHSIKRRSTYGQWLEANGFPSLIFDRSVVASALVAEDLPLAHRRLAGSEATQELFAEIDRTQSEGELRLAIWFPLAVAIVVVAVSEWGAWGLLSLPVAVIVGFALAYGGVSRLEAANDSIIDSVRTSGAPPTLELLRETANQQAPGH